MVLPLPCESETVPEKGDKMQKYIDAHQKFHSNKKDKRNGMWRRDIDTIIKQLQLKKNIQINYYVRKPMTNNNCVMQALCGAFVLPESTKLVIVVIR